MVDWRMCLAKGSVGALLSIAAAGTGRAEAQPLLPSGPEIPVDIHGGVQGASLAAVFPDGGFVVAWTACAPASAGGQCGLRARLFASDGAPRTAEISLLPPVGQQLDDLAPTADGGFWIAWELQYRHLTRSVVMARRYDHQARPLTPPFFVQDLGDRSTLYRYGARLAATADGGAVIAWNANDLKADHSFREDIVVRFFAPDGTPRAPALNLGPGDQFANYPAGIGAEPDGSAWVLKESFAGANLFGNLYLQHFAADGTAGPRIAVCSGSTICTPSLTFPFVNEGTLAMRPDGTLVVLWTYNENETGAPPRDGPAGAAYESVILGRLFGPDGIPLGDAFQVNKYLSSEVSPAVAALPDGRFVAMWSDLDDAANLAGVYGRSFAADGTPTSGDFRPMAGVPGSLAAGGGGNVVAVFQLPGGRLVAQRFTTP